MADSEVRISKAISYATKAFGYSELRPNQELAVKHFLRGHDVFVSLPTGSGKSLCYCLLPKAFDFLWQRIESTQSILVVVSPLIALMQDQVRAMRERGATVVYAGVVEDELERSICSGDFQLVFLSPESLINGWSLARYPLEFCVPRNTCC